MSDASQIPQIGADTPAGLALARLMAIGGAELARQLARMMVSDDPEFPHKTRVATRKLRATLTAFRPIIAKSRYRRDRDSLRDLARSIGLLRDADVLAQSFRLPEFAANADRLRQQTRDALGRAGAADFATRLGPGYGDKSWHRSGHGSKAARQSAVPPLAAAALAASWQACCALGPDLTAMPEAARHDLRKGLKRLRYLTDQFAPLWPGPPRKAFVKLLAPVQDDLGALNDLAVARSHGMAAPDDPKTLAHAQKLWSRLATCPPFWPTP